MVCQGVLAPAGHQAHQRSCVASADSTGVNWPAEYRTAEIQWSDETPWNWRNEIEAVGSAEPGLHMAKMTLFVRRERPALGRSSCSVASLALRWCCRSGGWWLARGEWLGLGLVLLGAVAGPAQDAAAQANIRQVDAQVNLPYAVQFGFGSYDVGGLSVNVFRVPVKHTFKLEDAWRLVLTGYLGYGHFSFETSVFGPKITASEDFAFVLPQAELQIPLRRWWTVKPYVAAGLGRTFNASAAIEGPPGGEFHVEEGFVFLYAAGISNLFEFQVHDFFLSVGTRLAGAGDAGQSTSTNYGTLQNGLEVRHPLGFPVKDLEPDVGVSFIYYHFFPSAKFSLPGGSPLEVSNQFEFGMDVGSLKPITLWIFEIEKPRIGVSYRFGDGLTGVRVQFGFPF